MQMHADVTGVDTCLLCLRGMCSPLVSSMQLTFAAHPSTASYHFPTCRDGREGWSPRSAQTDTPAPVARPTLLSNPYTPTPTPDTFTPQPPHPKPATRNPHARTANIGCVAIPLHAEGLASDSMFVTLYFAPFDLYDPEVARRVSDKSVEVTRQVLRQAASACMFAPKP